MIGNGGGMLEVMGERQKNLLILLLRHKAGLTVDELSVELAITRNAVRQHLAALEAELLVKKGTTRASGGRPEQLYVLTEKGQESFPRHYALLAQLLVESIAEEEGEDWVVRHLTRLGRKMGTQLAQPYASASTLAAKIEKLAEVMAQLGYSARVVTEETTRIPMIEADNCIFHQLALAQPAVCQFDLALLASFSQGHVAQQQCMAKGDGCCRFQFTEITAIKSE